MTNSVEADKARSATRLCLWAVLSAWALVLVLHEIPIGGTWLPVAISTWVYLISWVGLFAVAFVASNITFIVKPLLPAEEMAQARISLPVIILTMTSLVGALLVVFEFVVIRGYGFTTSAAEIRVSEVTAAIQGTSVQSSISGAGRLMIPAILPALIIAVANFRFTNQPARAALAIAIPIILYEQIAFEGGRILLASTFIIVVVSYLLGAARDNKSRRSPIRRIPYFRFGIIAAVLLYFFIYVFIDRILERGDFFWSSYKSFSADFYIFVGTDTIARFEGFFGPFWFGMSMLWLYVTQGVNELDLLLSSQNIPNSFGLYQFPQVSPIASILFGTDLSYDFFNILPNTGTYLTIFGANYLDFGFVGAFLSALLLGALTARSVTIFTLGKLSGLAICGPIFFAVALFSPVISAVTTVWPAIAWAFAAAILIKAQSPATGR